MMTDPFGPNERPDAKPLSDNAIRRFREELRMDRPEFADLIDANVDTLRVWEKGSSKPRAQSAMRIIEIAERNYYPLTLADIFPVTEKSSTVSGNKTKKNLTTPRKGRTKK